jgi:hypothetical protein
MRIWFSGPRLLNGLVRPGISLGREDFGPPRLPRWRRHELRAGLQSAAKLRGEAMTNARPIMRQALATGQLTGQIPIVCPADLPRAETLPPAGEKTIYVGAWSRCAVRSPCEVLSSCA